MLIADDEEDLVDVLRDRLEAYGFTVITASTGREALEKLATEPVDGIFLDVKMPDLDGLAALDAIRRRDPQTPIIIPHGLVGTTMPPQTPWPAGPMPMS